MKPRFFGSVILMICFLGLDSLEQKHFTQFWNNITGNANLIQMEEIAPKKDCCPQLAQCGYPYSGKGSDKCQSVLFNWVFPSCQSSSKLECKSAGFDEAQTL